VATRHLGGGKPRTVGFSGTGVQARYLLAAHRGYFEGFEVLVADVLPEAAERFAAEAGGRAVSLAEAAACDVVNTATPSRQPVVLEGWLRQGAHVNAMGADAPGKQELATSLVLGARVFVDDLHQATHSGEVNVPLHEGALTEHQLAGTLGEVVAGLKPARPQGNETTIFDSTGLAVQDVALARRAYEAALAAGVGIDLPLVE
jgi:ornithine cyclodeaminase/alanine dehydrogenase